MAKLTKSVLDALPRPDKTKYCFDDDLKGFGVRLNRDVSKTFVIQAQFNGKQVRHNIGKYPPMPPTVARKRATELLYHLQLGRDLLAEEQQKAKNPPQELLTHLCHYH